MIGIIGQGFVGSAVNEKFSNFFRVLTYDIDKNLSNSKKRIVQRQDVVFICLPTPMNPDGSCHTEIVEKELDLLNTIGIERIIVVKSTVPPGTTARWNAEYENLNIVFNPEFLTERNAIKDYDNQKRIILGGERPATTKLKTIFSKVFPDAKVIKTDSTHAELVKYLTNAFLSVKVSFANEMYQICEEVGADYDKVIEYALDDERLGKSHWSVPGPDGDFGFGGHCFPKDLSAIIQVAIDLKATNNVLWAARKTNEEVRGTKDWLDMKGRAVT
jgi:UDPglucose 6-dehydrogenase